MPLSLREANQTEPSGFAFCAQTDTVPVRVEPRFLGLKPRFQLCSAKVHIELFVVEIADKSVTLDGGTRADIDPFESPPTSTVRRA